jgi:hypothetical protein
LPITAAFGLALTKIETLPWCRHREEHSDEAIQRPLLPAGSASWQAGHRIALRQALAKFAILSFL